MKKYPKIVEKKYSYFAVSIAIIVLGLVLLLTVGVNLGIEFAGGVKLEATVKNMSEATISNADYVKLSEFVKAELEFLKLNPSEGQKIAEGVVFSFKNEIDGREASAEAMGLLTSKLIMGRTLTEEERGILRVYLGNDFNFGAYRGIALNTDEFDLEIYPHGVSNTMSTRMFRDALMALVIALTVIVVYITIRFWNIGKLSSAAAVLIALIHDVLIMISFMIVAGWLFNMSISSTFVAAVVTIVSYSINNAVVIFDRIRENHKNDESMEPVQLVNKSIADVFRRTVYAAGTTLMVVLVLTFVGISTIREFTVPIIVGISAGVYSAFFIASPMWSIFKAIGIGRAKKGKGKTVAATPSN